jgi:phage-related protein
MATAFVGSISALFTGGLFGAITSTFGAIVSVISGAFSAVAGVVSAIFSPIGVAIMAIIGIIMLLKNHWDEVVAWFAPGIQSMEEGLAQLASAWKNIQPLISAVMPLFVRVATLLGGVIVGAVSLLFRAFMAAFNAIAGVINWVTDLVSGLAGVIGWVSDLLGGLIDKALNFIGIKSEIGSVNTSITQGWADKAMAGGSVNVTQNNEYTFTNPMQYGAAASTNNDWASSFT